MCYGDTITIKVSAANHGVADLTNATQVLGAGAEHLTGSSCAAVSPLVGLFSLGLVVLTLGFSLWVLGVSLWALYSMKDRS